MLFSRNPISGVVEVYTDEGEYVGKIGMMGDAPLDDKSEGLTEDGGPGSGNHNHAGRPGQVGGSAKEGSTSAEAEKPKHNTGNRVKFDTSKMPTLKNFDYCTDRSQTHYEEKLSRIRDKIRDEYGNSKSLLKQVDDFQDAAYEWNDKMREAFDKFDFSIRADGAGIEGILGDGRVKTQFETGTSNGLYDPLARYGVSEQLFHTEEGTPDSDYEVYGFLDDARNAMGYGDFRIVLDKDKVYNRATFTIGDSLDNIWWGGINPSLVSDPHSEWDAMRWAEPTLVDRSRQAFSETIDRIRDTGSNGGTYIELQFHGGITTDDIAYIEAKDNPNKYSLGEIEEIERLAKDKGVAIRWV